MRNFITERYDTGIIIESYAMNWLKGNWKCVATRPATGKVKFKILILLCGFKASLKL